MKKSFFICLAVLSFFNLTAQTKTNNSLQNNTEFSFHAGLNFISLSRGWESFIAEGKSHLTNDLLIKLSLGYSKVVSPFNYKVKSYSVNYFDKSYNEISYNVLKTVYYLIPISLGLQYNINYSKFNPYIFTEIGYNLIDPKTIKSAIINGNNYSTYGELPLEYRYKDILPNGSYKIAIGVGFKYTLTSIIALDLRYLTQIDSEIINSQQFLVGIIF